MLRHFFTNNCNIASWCLVVTLCYGFGWSSILTGYTVYCTQCVYCILFILQKKIKLNCTMAGDIFCFSFSSDEETEFLRSGTKKRNKKKILFMVIVIYLQKKLYILILSMLEFYFFVFKIKNRIEIFQNFCSEIQKRSL